MPLRIINIEETPDKIVGRRQAPRDPLAAMGYGKKEARAWEAAFPARLGPRGVYRFKTHEEAEAWLWKMITRPRKS